MHDMHIVMSVAVLERMPICFLRFLSLIARVDNESTCLLTCCVGKEISCPLMGSDNRVYDAFALCRWLSTGADHVVPGCPITYVSIRLWTASELFHAMCNFMVAMCVTTKKEPLHHRVISFHTKRIRGCPRGAHRFHHNSATSGFTPVIPRMC